MKKPMEQVETAHTLAVAARQRAHAPYSKFKVGAALMTERGRVVVGCNIENASYGGTVCAERVAILKAVSEGDSQFSDIVIVTDADKPAFPCALCLQTMAEFFSPEVKVWIADTDRIHGMHRFKDLLPEPFGPAELSEARVEKPARSSAGKLSGKLLKKVKKTLSKKKKKSTKKRA